MPTVSPERMAKIKLAWQEYKSGKITGEINLNILEKKYGIKASTLGRHFKNLDHLELIAGGNQPHSTQRVDVSRAVSQETVKDRYETKLVDESKDIVDTALSLGTVIVTRYRPQLEAFVAMGKSPDDMAIEVMSWYEQKLNFEEMMRKRDLDIMELQRRVEEISLYAKPNYVFEVKARLMRDFMLDLVRARALGISLNVKRAIEFYNKRLDYYQEQTELVFSPKVEMEATGE